MSRTRRRADEKLFDKVSPGDLMSNSTPEQVASHTLEPVAGISGHVQELVAGYHVLVTGVMWYYCGVNRYEDSLNRHSGT